MTNDPRNQSSQPLVPPSRVARAASSRDRARRRVAGATMTTAMLATLGTLGLTGYLGGQAALNSAATGSSAQTTIPASAATSTAGSASSSTTTAPVAASSSSSISASSAAPQVKTGGS